MRVDLEVVIPSRSGEPRLRPAPSQTQEVASIMGLPFERVDQRTLVRLFLEDVRARQGGWIVTPNLDILRRFTASPESRELILAATHRVADGQPIVWA